MRIETHWQCIHIAYSKPDDICVCERASERSVTAVKLFTKCSANICVSISMLRQSIFCSTMFRKGPRPLIIFGPSGSGKSTLLKKLFEEYPNTFGFRWAIDCGKKLQLQNVPRVSLIHVMFTVYRIQLESHDKARRMACIIILQSVTRWKEPFKKANSWRTPSSVEICMVQGKSIWLTLPLFSLTCRFISHICPCIRIIVSLITQQAIGATCPELGQSLCAGHWYWRCQAN